MLLKIQAQKHAIEFNCEMLNPMMGRVHSVFRHAVNFAWKDHRITTLLLAPKPLSPEGILVSRDAFQKAAERDHALLMTVNGYLPFTVGEEVTFFSEKLTTNRFVIDLSGCPAVNLKVSSCACLETIHQSLKQWLPEALLGKGLVSGLRSEVFFGSGRIAELETVLEKMVFSDVVSSISSVEDLKRSLDRFIGLGEGLTPSGDDFIVGLCWVMTVDPMLCTTTLLPLVRQVLGSCLEKTNFISGQMLRYAVEARFTEPLVRLARADNRTDLRAVFEDIAAFGHTSGLDTLCGLSVGLDISARLKNSFHKSAPTASNGTKAAVCAV